MVARITPTASLAKLLSYNEEKVTQGKAKFIHAGNFLQERDDLDYAERLYRFQQLNELNGRSKVKMLHATLNFQPGEKLSDEQLTAIADRYMQGLEMEDQPYLVYRHEDANHPHIHIISSLIRPDGSRINTDHMAIRLSEPTRKAIEKEFDLQPAQRRTRMQTLSPEEVQKIVPGSDRPITQSIDDITATVTKHYQFTDLHEYNAILRSYNVIAETGGPESKSRRYNGIYYTALDDHGNKISPPVMASQLTNRPTLKRLNEHFEESRLTRRENITSIRHRIDWILDQEPSTLRVLAADLQRDGIEIVRPRSNGRNPHDHIYVDHRTRTAVAGSSVGQAYTAMALGSSFKKSSTDSHHHREKSIEKTRFNANTPQLLSAVFNIRPGDPEIDPLRQDHSLRNRPKL
ncbi:MAG TPA: relaxase/mobilization nuclease domain-containing protein [Puia sp.]|jgi:hypothetical protein|nr:relaxase/mobilization nuclease domain-containing protein [Puia sp.]